MFSAFSLTSLHTEMHTLCSNGTKVCTENQNRCCLLLLFFFFSLSFVNLFVCQSDGWLACVCRVKKDWLRARNSRSGCIYFELENNIFRCHLSISRLSACLGSAVTFRGSDTVDYWVRFPLSVSFQPYSRHMPQWKDFTYFIYQMLFHNGVRAVFSCPFLVLREHSLHSAMLRSHFACTRFSFLST